MCPCFDIFRKFDRKKNSIRSKEKPIDRKKKPIRSKKSFHLMGFRSDGFRSDGFRSDGFRSDGTTPAAAQCSGSQVDRADAL